MPKKKTSITMRIDPDVLAWYKAHSPAYQLTLQEVLQRHMTRTQNPMPGDLSMPAETKPPTLSDDPKPCVKCKGNGIIKKKVGKLFVQVACPTCKGSGWTEHVDPPGSEGVADADIQKGITEDPSGSLVTIKDARHGDLRLERLCQPLYDTQVHGTMFDVPMARRDEFNANPPPIMFFQNGGGPKRGPAITNVQSSAQLYWPKRFDVDGIRISFSHLVDISEASLMLQIGEKPYLTLPLKNMDRDDDPIKDAEHGPLLPRMRLKHVGITPTIHIPPVQWFGVQLNTGGKYFESAEIRVQLDGTIYREIC
jgi:hypothetical protein